MADIYLKDKNGSKVPYYNVNSVSFDGLSEGTQEVFVASGSQTKVQSDWYENDATADSYVKNRPGGYYTTIESKTYTFDGDITGKETVSMGEERTLVKITNDSVLNSQINTITSLNISNDGVAQTVTTMPAYESGLQILIATDDNLTAKLTTPVILVANIEQGKGESVGIPDGLWFVIYTKTKDGADTNIYPTSITTTSVKIAQTIPQEFLSTKQSDWAASTNSVLGLTDGYIKNRVGGFIDTGSEDITLDFDGNIDDKEYYTFTDKITLVKALDYPLTKTQMLAIKANSVGVHVNDGLYQPTTVAVEGEFTQLFCYALGATITYNEKSTNVTGLITLPVGNIVEDTFQVIPPGTYFVLNTADIGTTYFSTLQIPTTALNIYPSEFLDSDFSGRKFKASYVFANNVIIPSSTSGSTKKYQITVNDEGVISAVLYSS